jgi:hypothetical protein
MPKVQPRGSFRCFGNCAIASPTSNLSELDCRPDRFVSNGHGYGARRKWHNGGWLRKTTVATNPQVERKSEILL